MAIKHSPGCGCCVDGVTGCCLDTALKDLPTVSYDPLTSTYTFSETQWYYTDSNGDRQTYFTGDVPADGSSTPNILPAGSTVQAEFNICCLDYIFEVEILTWDQNDNNSYVKCGATQWRSWDWDSSTAERSFIQSRTAYNVLTNSNFYTGSYKKGYSTLELGAHLGNGRTEERVIAFNYTPQRSSPGFIVGQQAVFAYGRGNASWATSLSRPIKLVIHAGDSDLEIGAIRLRQGSNTLSSTSPNSCINYSSTVAGVTVDWARVNKGVSIYKAGYGTTTFSVDHQGFNDCIGNAGSIAPLIDFTGTMDFSGRNGNWSYELTRLNNDTNSFTGSVSASLDDQTAINNLATACRTDDWESISLIPEWWRLWWVGPDACPAAVPDDSNCASGYGSPYSVDPSCTSPTNTTSWGSSNSWPWTFTRSINTSQPCPSEDFWDFIDETVSGFYQYRADTTLYQSLVTWLGYGDPNWAGASLQSTINSHYSTTNPGHPRYCSTYGASYNPYQLIPWLASDQLPFYNIDKDMWDSPNALNPSPGVDRESNTISSVSHDSAGFSYLVSDQANVAHTGYVERQLSFTVYKSWVDTSQTITVDCEVQGGWQGETLFYIDYEKESIPDTKQGRTIDYKIHENCIHDFTVTETVYSGSPPTAGTPSVATQSSASVIPNLSYQGASSTRPSGVYDDGNIYQYSDSGSLFEYFNGGYFLHEVSTDDGETWHILFNYSGGIAECRRLSDNTKFSSPTATGTPTGCNGQDFTLTDGNPAVAGTVTEITFTVKGTR